MKGKKQKGLFKIMPLSVAALMIFAVSVGAWLGLQINIASAAALSATNVQPASLVAGSTNQVTISFTPSGTPAGDIPVDGKIKVTFGAGYDLSGVGAAAGTCATMDGTFVTSVAGQVVTITRQGDGTIELGNTAQTCTINTIVNPGVSGTTGTYTIETTTTGDVQIDIDAAVSADTITAGALTATNVAPAT